MKHLSTTIFLFIYILFSAQADSLEITKEADKFGIKLNNKIVVPIKYESVKIEKKIISAKINNTYDLFSFSGKIISAKIKKYFILKFDAQIQILNDKNEIEYINSIGEKLNYMNYYHNYGIYTFDKIETQIDSKKNHIKFLYPNTGARNDTLRIIQYEQKVPKRIKLISFMNNSLSQYAEYQSFFTTLNSNFVVVKIQHKYGIWNYDEKKMILNCIYDNIKAYNTHLVIEKNGLYTIYPNLGTLPKYKKITPYEYFLARFKNIDNKEGWVDRNGFEYYDQ